MVAPCRNPSDIVSTTTATPSFSNTLSSPFTCQAPDAPHHENELTASVWTTTSCLDAISVWRIFGSPTDPTEADGVTLSSPSPVGGGSEVAIWWKGSTGAHLTAIGEREGVLEAGAASSVHSHSQQSRGLTLRRDGRRRHAYQPQLSHRGV
jgi:hypothetical protein